MTDTYTYEAFGNSTGSSGSTPNPYKYVGSLGYYGTGSSLMHLGARYYMPEIGRLISRDETVHISSGGLTTPPEVPAWFTDGSSLESPARSRLGMTAGGKYAYCMQSTPSCADPSGREDFMECVKRLGAPLAPECAAACIGCAYAPGWQNPFCYVCAACAGGAVGIALYCGGKYIYEKVKKPKPPKSGPCEE